MSPKATEGFAQANGSGSCCIVVRFGLHSMVTNMGVGDGGR